MLAMGPHMKSRVFRDGIVHAFSFDTIKDRMNGDIIHRGWVMFCQHRTFLMDLPGDRDANRGDVTCIRCLAHLWQRGR